MTRRHQLPFITIPCPICGEQAVLRSRSHFQCGYGHQTEYSDPEFACLKDGCKRTAQLTRDTTLSCGRHEINPGRIFKCY